MANIVNPSLMVIGPKKDIDAFINFLNNVGIWGLEHCKDETEEEAEVYHPYDYYHPYKDKYIVHELRECKWGFLYRILDEDGYLKQEAAKLDIWFTMESFDYMTGRKETIVCDNGCIVSMECKIDAEWLDEFAKIRTVPEDYEYKNDEIEECAEDLDDSLDWLRNL